MEHISSEWITIPESLCELNSLKKIDLSKNNIEGEIPKNIYNIKKLVVINLSNNNLSINSKEALKDNQYYFFYISNQY